MAAELRRRCLRRPKRKGEIDVASRSAFRAPRLSRAKVRDRPSWPRSVHSPPLSSSSPSRWRRLSDAGARPSRRHVSKVAIAFTFLLPVYMYDGPTPFVIRCPAHPSPALPVPQDYRHGVL